MGDTAIPDFQAELNALMQARPEAVEDWLRTREATAGLLPYGSVDLRHSGHKLVPVDTNVFPAGFNNLTPQGRQSGTEALQGYLRQHFPEARRILLVPENHTRNLGYLENLATLLAMLEQAGFETVIGRLDLAAEEEFAFETADGRRLAAWGVARRQDRLVAGAQGFDADLIWLNNDLTSGRPPLLEGLSQPVVPPLEMGWHNRRKSVHFEAYARHSRDFAEAFGLDPWRLGALFERCGRINFREKSGLECVALGVERVLHRLREKYREYGIAQEPYVFVKADSGTYGMGITTMRSGEEAFAINKKTRNKMDVIKEGAQSTEVIIQEGVPTLDRVEGAFAEPVVYLAAHRPVGAVWRINAERSAETNLNAAGMRFLPMAGGMPPALGLIARLAMLAAASEEYEPA